MTKKPKLNPINPDDNQAATKDDIDELAQSTKKTLDRVEQQLNHIQTTMATKDDLKKLEQRIDNKFTSMDDKFATKDAAVAILNVVTAIEARLKSWEQIPAKVDRLHKRIFPH